jgi:hypothetical protein
MPRSFIAFAIPVALVIPFALMASTTGKRSAVREAAFACRASAAFRRPNSAFFRFSTAAEFHAPRLGRGERCLGPVGDSAPLLLGV